MTALTQARTQAWIQRVGVIAVLAVAILTWRNYQTSNGLRTTQTGQRFIDEVDAA